VVAGRGSGALLALNQSPEPFALGCDIVEECVAGVSKAHAKGVNQTRE